LNTVAFRVRDDLLTPLQLRELSATLQDLPFKPRWTARCRFQAALTSGTLRDARAAGLDQLWMGLESAVPRVRALMDKGVAQDTVLRNLDDAWRAGVGVRALCMVGFPTETVDEARETIDFIADHAPRLAGASITPFQLMRGSPMARRLGEYGISVGPDPLPRWARIRQEIPMTGGATMGPEAVGELMSYALSRLSGPFKDHLGPWPSHDWLARPAPSTST